MGGIEYYKPDNDASKANFLYDPSLGSHWNRIDQGIFTKTDDNRFEFHYYYYDGPQVFPHEDEDNYWEDHIYDYNYLRLDTSSLTNFVSNGELTIRIFLSGYDEDSSKLDKNTFFVRHFNCTVFSDKDNLNNQNWDFTGDGYTLQDIDGGLILNSGSISLDDTNCPDKTYIDSNSDLKYRAVSTHKFLLMVVMKLSSLKLKIRFLKRLTLTIMDGLQIIIPVKS
ncbi:hypothetical protein ES705_37793 [subsurface metagenome]